MSVGRGRQGVRSRGGGCLASRRERTREGGNASLIYFQEISFFFFLPDDFAPQPEAPFSMRQMKRRDKGSRAADPIVLEKKKILLKSNDATVNEEDLPKALGEKSRTVKPV